MSFGTAHIIQLLKSHFQTVVFSINTRADSGEMYTTRVVAEPVYGGRNGSAIVQRWVYMDIRRIGGQYRRKTTQLMAEVHFQQWYFEFS